MQTRPGNQRRKPLHELQRAQDQMRRAVAPRCLQLQLDLPGGIDLHPFVGKRRAGDVAAQLLQPLAVMGFDPHRGVQAESVDVGAQRLAGRVLARHRASQGQHLLPGARPEGDSVGDGRGLQRPQRARLLAVGIRLGQVGLAHVFDQHAPAREHLHQPGDDGLQQRVQFVVGGRIRLNEGRRTIGVAAVHPVQYQTVQVDVEVGGRAKALDQRDGAAVTFVSLEPRLPQQMSRDHALHHLQHRRDQFRLRGQQHAQRDRQRQHPLPHRHVRDDVVDQVRSGLRHAPGAARGAESPALAAEGQQLVVAALAAA